MTGLITFDTLCLMHHDTASTDGERYEQNMTCKICLDLKNPAGINLYDETFRIK